MKESWIDFLAILVGIFAGICIVISYIAGKECLIVFYVKIDVIKEGGD